MSNIAAIVTHITAAALARAAHPALQRIGVSCPPTLANRVMVLASQPLFSVFF